MSITKEIDLVMLVPGNDEKEAFDGLLSSRGKSLKFLINHYEILKHPQRDPGCFLRAPEILVSYQNLARYSLVVFDYEGSGQEDRPPEDVANDLKKRLENKGWKDRTEALILRPELENWVWSGSPVVDQVIGWKGRRPALRKWLNNQGWWSNATLKPERPKECLEAALREVRMPRSSAIYRQLAERVGLGTCRDEGFLAFRQILQRWFPMPEEETSERWK